MNIDNENFFSYESVLARFKRAKSEYTLGVMYTGAIRRAANNLQGKDLFLAQIAIERALDQCQQLFDTSQLGMARKIDHALKQTEASKSYNPEAELKKLLSGLDY
ncbi:hypothetical protein [Aeromonas taiwanensis]|uniref:hypothetical protein n=1 Tax=Aeromonas taiwanensis TaxID=633417 RepID=UPI003B9FFCA2